MSSNRYTEVNWNQPISTYVPMPLDFIYKAGLQKQSQYDRALEESDKLQNLMTKVNAIDAHKEYKKQLADKYYGRINEIADKIVSKGDLSAQRDLNKIAREWQNDPVRQELEESYANYAAYQKDKIAKGEKYAEWHDPTMSFIGHGEQGPNAFRYTGMLERTDHQKRAQDMMDKVAYDAAESAGFKINPDGTITKGGSGSEHILSQKIAELASMKVGDFLTTSEGQDFAKQLKYYNPQLSKEDLTKQATKYLYDAGANQIFNRTKRESDVGFTPDYNDKAAKSDALSGLVGYSLEGKTYNPIDNDIQFKNLENQGVLAKDDKGNVKVNWSALGDTEKKTYTKYDYDKGSVARQTGVEITKGDQKQMALYEQMQKMAKAVGFKGELNSKNYDLIASAYNTYSKARLFAEQLPEPVQMLESGKVDSNWENITAYDPTNTDTPRAEKPLRKPGDRIIVNERQTNSRGEMIKKGVIVREDGTREPFAYKDNALESSNYFDAIGNLGVTSAKFQVGQLDPAIDEKGKRIKTAEGLNLVTSTDVPYVGTVFVVGDDKDRTKIKYKLVSDIGESKSFDNYSDLQRHLEIEYYTKVPEGKSDLNYLLSKKQDKMMDSFPQQKQ